MGPVLRAAFAVLAILLPLPSPAAHEAGGKARILYFNDADPRVPASAEKLRRAVRSSPWYMRHPAEVELVVVDFASPSLEGDIRAALAGRKVAAIVAPNGIVALAAQRATTTVPIVFGVRQDPVAIGIARSMQAPGNNLTGFTQYSPVESKRVELLLQFQPGIRTLGVVIDRWWSRDPTSWGFDAMLRERFGISARYHEVESMAQLEALLASEAATDVDAWYVYSNAFDSDAPRATALLGATCKPAVYTTTRWAAEGALIAYQPVIDDPFALWAKLLGAVLAGRAPGTIPIEGPRRFELHLNKEAARRCGLAIPRALATTATRVH